MLLLIAQFIKADGYISTKKIKHTKAYLYKKFGSYVGSNMMKTLNDLIKKSVNVYDIANEVSYRTSQQSRKELITFLYEMGIQNGKLDNSEKKLIETIAKGFGLTKDEFEAIIFEKKKTKNTNKSYTYSYYKILGVTSNSSNEEIKKKYRKLVLKYHPDKTKLDIKVATKRFNEISEAYAQVKKLRNIK